MLSIATHAADSARSLTRARTDTWWKGHSEIRAWPFPSTVPGALEPDLGFVFTSEWNVPTAPRLAGLPSFQATHQHRCTRRSLADTQTRWTIPFTRSGKAVLSLSLFLLLSFCDQPTDRWSDCALTTSAVPQCPPNECRPIIAIVLRIVHDRLQPHYMT